MRYFVFLLLVFGLNSFANELNVSPDGVWHKCAENNALKRENEVLKGLLKGR